MHFPTWALAQRQVRLEGCATLSEAVDRDATLTAMDGMRELGNAQFRELIARLRPEDLRTVRRSIEILSRVADESARQPASATTPTTTIRKDQP